MEEARSNYFAEYLHSLEQQEEERDSFFKRIYHCYSLSMIKENNNHLEEGNRIIMPASALDLLVDSDISYPMMFKIRNMTNGKVSHSGVEEFIAEEGSIYLPKLVMGNLELSEGDPVILENVDLQKGTYMKLQPHSKNFLKISDHKEVLERQLRSFSCVTKGNTIVINHEDKKFYVDVVETKPDVAVSLIDTDCEVDFACPLDYVELEKPTKLPVTRKLVRPKILDEPAREDLKFKPFAGVSRRLASDSDSSSEDVSSNATNTPELKHFERPLDYAKPENSTKSILNRKLVRPKVPAEGPGQKEDSKFNPFIGVSRRLIEEDESESGY